MPIKIFTLTLLVSSSITLTANAQIRAGGIIPTGSSPAIIDGIACFNFTPVHADGSDASTDAQPSLIPFQWQKQLCYYGQETSNDPFLETSFDNFTPNYPNINIINQDPIPVTFTSTESTSTMPVTNTHFDIIAGIFLALQSMIFIISLFIKRI